MTSKINEQVSDKSSAGIGSVSDADSHNRRGLKKRIGVIGAGFSGLTAAAELKRIGETFRSMILFITCGGRYYVILHSRLTRYLASVKIIK